MKAYERVAESGGPTPAQETAATQIKGDGVLLADGRFRIYEMDGDIIRAIHYVAPDGSVEVEQ